MKKYKNSYYRFCGHLLSYIRYRNKRDPFADFTKLRSGEMLPRPIEGTILILPFRVAPVSNLFEGILGYAFRARGYRVISLLCGRNLNHCDNVACTEFRCLACPLCFYEQKRFASTFGMEEDWLDNLTSEKKRRLLRKMSNSIPLDDIFQYAYEGVQIGKHVLGALQRYTLTSAPDLKENERVGRGFLLTALTTVEAVRSAIKRYNPDLIVSSHGVYSTWGSAIETAVSENVRCVTWGRGYFMGRVVAAHNSSYLLASNEEADSFWEKQELTSFQREKTLEYFQLKREPGSGVDFASYYKRSVSISKAGVLEKLNLHPKRQRIGMYSSIPWDGQTFGYSEAFPRIGDWVRCTMEWFAKRPDVDLIIRAHPAEKGREGIRKLETFESIVKKLYPERAANVRFIGSERHDVSSYMLSEICRAALIYGSTLGLEFAVVGHPVISAGRIHWSNKGILFDAGSPEEYKSLLGRAAAGDLKMSSEMRERAIKYAHYWLFHKHMPEAVISMNSLTYTGYKIKSATELKPGGNDAIDWFIDCCLNGKPFLW